MEWTACSFYKKLGFKGRGLPYTEKMYEKCLMLPMNTSLTNSEADYISEKIISFYAQ